MITRKFETFFSETWNGIKDFFANIWNSITTTVTTVLSTISSAITSAWTAVKTTFTTIWDSIAGVVSSVWETIKNVVQVGILFIEELFSAAFQILTVPFRFIWENCQEILTAAWEAIKSIVSTAIDAVKTTLETTWNAIWSVLSPIIETIKTGITTAWEAIKIGVSTAVDAVKTTLETTWNAIWSALSPIIETIKTGITTAWETIKTSVTTAVDAVKTTLETTWNAIWSVLSPIIETIKTGITTAWETIQTGVTNAVTTLQTTLSNVWNAIKSTISTTVDNIKTSITTAWDTAKSSVSSTMNSMKSTISSVWTSIKTTVSTAVDAAKNAISNGFNAAKSTVSNIFGNIKSSISNAMSNAKTAVANAISTIKSKLNFSWSLPHLKLPHVTITGEFSLDPPSVPHFSISWYKKAMEDGMILNAPTIFGMKGNQLLAGGEAGSETVVGTQSLMEMIRNAVASMAGGTTINYGGGNIRHEFIYNGMNSRDYGLRISGEDTWTRPQPDVKRISVPGRNGDLIQLGNRYQNLDITYHCGIVKNLRTNFDAFNAKLLSEPGYHRLEDSYHPEYFRMAVFESALDPDVKKRALAGEVDIKFNCKPQLFLKSGEIEQTVMDGGYIYNPTPYTAAPTLRFKFPDSEEGGSITINGVTISIQKPGSGEDFIIDCERQDIYLRGGRVNKNNDFVLSNGEFFELKPGRNKVQCTGTDLNRVWITPNWWTV